MFLLTNTDPDGPKHKNLTMFLVPLDSPGVDIQPIRTVDGDRTNIVFYSDVRVDDRYRIGPVNGGWGVLRGALDEEHGTVKKEDDGLQRIAVMSEHLTLMAEAIDEIAALVTRERPDGNRLIDDSSVAYRLGRSVARTEAALGTPGMFGRVANAQTMRDCAPDLMDILGTASALPVDAEGAADSSRQWRRGIHFPAGLTRRHLRRHPRGVPQHDRPACAGARAAELFAAEVLTG